MSATSSHRRPYPGTNPGRRTIGWLAVVALHILILWALVTGTARKGLELIKKPMEAAVIQEVIIPPPPPPPPKEIVKPPPAPKVEAPPPPYVPPPEIAPPVSAAPAITTAPEPPKEEYKIEAPPPPATAPAPPAGPVNIGVVCPQQVKPEIPRKALQEGVSGVVRAQARIVDGAVKEVTVLSGPRVFHPAVKAAMQQYKCNSSGEVTAIQEFEFKID